ncbi:hypothetical protein ACIBH1_34105 [Nonomuraea sp. NPDC050663]|uniref:hypothetical protein n=1 Tax=Nonomuraea sp. NPDC050663 TaxID=3364370 RepID=UPI0037A25A24
MKFPLIAALSAVLLLPLAGTGAASAAAHPVKDRTLTANALYGSGPLAQTTCVEPAIKPNNRTSARKYLDAVFTCLEAAWGPHLTAAGLPYEPIKVEHVTSVPKKWCNGEDSKQAWEFAYCDWDGVLKIKLGGRLLDHVTDLWLFESAAYMYGLHVTDLTGMYDAGENLRAGSKDEHYEQMRRHSLQAACLGAVFTRSVWPLEGRTDVDWQYYLYLLAGDQPGRPREDGSAASLRHWAERGFATGDPGSCNTWSAPSSRVS